jgi:hypothetical protein
MAHRRTPHLASDIPTEAARILYLTYGHDAVQMAELRCTELEVAGDLEGVATWKEVLKHVRVLSAANPEPRGTAH